MAKETNDPIQEQLIAARRNQILDAAATVFSEKGFERTTIKAVAKAAGIADGTIYIYFSNKSALLMGIFERMKSAFIQEHMPPNPENLDFRSFIHTTLKLPLMALKKDHFALFRIVVSEMLVNEELRAQCYQQVLQPSIEGGELYFQSLAKVGISAGDAQLIMRVISGLILGLILENIMGDDKLEAEWERLPDLLTDLLLNGLNK